MTKKQNISRLKEIDFSINNLRDAYINDHVDYLSALRDEALFSNWGVSVLVRIPADKDGKILENNVDEYSNFVDIYWIDTTETVVPKFTEYRQNVSEEGMSADGIDGIYPLEVLIPSKLHLPRNSRIIFNEYNSREEKIAREWVVLGTQMKQLSNSKTYTRVANCVPAREETYNNTETANGIIWFDCSSKKLKKNKTIRAFGTIWFIRNCIDNTKIRKVYKDSLYETTIQDYPLYLEKTNVLMYYDTNPKNILNGGKGFEVGMVFEVLDDNEDPVEIIIDNETRETIPLMLTVTKVSKSGKILGFELNTQTGYTDFNTDGELIINIGTTPQQEAIIKLVAFPWGEEIFQETLDTPIIENAKSITCIKNDTVFLAKNVTISVLN